VDAHSIHGYPRRRHGSSIKDTDVVHKAVMTLLISRVAPLHVRSPWAAISVLHLKLLKYEDGLVSRFIDSRACSCAPDTLVQSVLAIPASRSGSFTGTQRDPLESMSDDSHSANQDILSFMELASSS
jgi:hypothetical protein